MPINLEEHKVFVDSLQMEMVPLSVAKQALEEALAAEGKIDNAIELLTKAMSDINKTIGEND